MLTSFEIKNADIPVYLVMFFSLFNHALNYQNNRSCENLSSINKVWKIIISASFSRYAVAKNDAGIISFVNVLSKKI